MFRADITQSGRDLEVKLWKPDGSAICTGGYTGPPCRLSFHGQDNADGVLFFPDSEDWLFASVDPPVWFYLGINEVKRGTGHAIGHYVEGRIETLYDGRVYLLWTDAPSCYAPDHKLTFVRR
jgi:hypothetical protein